MVERNRFVKDKAIYGSPVLQKPEMIATTDERAGKEIIMSQI